MRKLNHFMIIIFSIFFLFSCSSVSNIENNSQSVKFSLIYTSDEHGWIDKYADYPGASAMMYNWSQLGIDLEKDALILSGGDNWTGSVISNHFNGKSTIAVMNKMGYDVSTIGNHEFDFSGDTLLSNMILTNFSFVAANIAYSGSSPFPYSVKPYVIKEIKGIKVGIIGLANTESEELNFPKNISGFKFNQYPDALTSAANNAKKDGAELLIVISHLCAEDIAKLSELAKKLDITAFFGAHCHNVSNKLINEVRIMETGSYLRNYALVNIHYDKQNKKLNKIDAEVFRNEPAGSVASIDSVVSKYKKIVDAQVSEVIGFASEIIKQKSPEMSNMITDSWLRKYPQADIAFVNGGGIRSSLAAGNITSENILGLLPFDNKLIIMSLKGSQVLECMDDFLLGGFDVTNGYVLKNNKIWNPDSTYKVITMDYLYEQKNSKFKKYDQSPVSLNDNYRNPLIEWIKSLKTSSNNPLNKYLDSKARR